MESKILILDETHANESKSSLHEICERENFNFRTFVRVIGVDFEKKNEKEKNSWFLSQVMWKKEGLSHGKMKLSTMKRQKRLEHKEQQQQIHLSHSIHNSIISQC